MICSEAPAVTAFKLQDIEFIPLAAGSGQYFMALSAGYYKGLAWNWNALVVAIQERTAVARHYRGCIERHNSKGG